MLALKSWRGAETGRQNDLITPCRSSVSLMLVMQQFQTGTDSLSERLDGLANHRMTTAANTVAISLRRRPRSDQAIAARLI